MYKFAMQLNTQGTNESTPVSVLQGGATEEGSFRVCYNRNIYTKLHKMELCGLGEPTFSS
jgi:hypothetical protein